MKVYIAGKITNNEDFKVEFKTREMALKIMGHTVLNPAELPFGLGYQEYMHICYAMIDVAEAVSLLENWIDSPGAKMEYLYAVEKGKHLLIDIVSDREKSNSKVMDESILQILKNGIITLKEYQKILEYYFLKGSETDYFGRGGVDGRGIYDMYIINYKKENESGYKVYEQY